MNISFISLFSRKSKKTIRQSIHWFLNNPPNPKPRPNSNCHLAIDATWFGRKNCLLVYWDTDLKYVQWWRYATSESSFEIIQDLLKLKEAGIVCSSITSDGGRGICRAVDIVYPDIHHQRCVAHIQRLGLTLVTRNPKTLPGKELRPLVLAVTKIETKQQRDEWISEFMIWHKKWNNFLKEKSYFKGTNKWWYTHKYLRRVRALITNSIENLFYYLEDQLIPKTTNGLEGRFGALKQHYRQHRGLSKERREAYLSWYVTIVINKEKPTRNYH